MTDPTTTPAPALAETLTALGEYEDSPVKLYRHCEEILAYEIGGRTYRVGTVHKGALGSRTIKGRDEPDPWAIFGALVEYAESRGLMPGVSMSLDGDWCGTLEIPFINDEGVKVDAATTADAFADSPAAALAAALLAYLQADAKRVAAKG